MNPALGLVGARPAPLAAGARLGAGRASDRGIALIVERVVWQIVLVDVAPEVLLGPVRQRVDLPQAARIVALELGRVRSGRGLLAPDPADPRVDPCQSALERVDLGRAAAA